MHTRFSDATSTVSAPVETEDPKSASPNTDSFQTAIANSTKSTSGVEIHGRRGQISKGRFKKIQNWTVDSGLLSKEFLICQTRFPLIYINLTRDALSRFPS